MILDGASLIAARRAMNACGYKLEDLIRQETGIDIKIVASNTKTALNTPPEERFYVCTGTQGEDASLLKIAEERNKNVSLMEMRAAFARFQTKQQFPVRISQNIVISFRFYRCMGHFNSPSRCLLYSKFGLY